MYTRNRAFRLYLSSKYGKAALLRPTARLAAQGQPPISRALFFSSLITYCPGLLGAGAGVAGPAAGEAAGSSQCRGARGGTGQEEAAAGGSATEAEALEVWVDTPALAAAQQQLPVMPHDGSTSPAAGVASSPGLQATAFKWQASRARRVHDVLLLAMFPESEAGQHQGLVSLEQLRAGERALQACWLQVHSQALSCSQ